LFPSTEASKNGLSLADEDNPLFNQELKVQILLLVGVVKVLVNESELPELNLNELSTS
jgi:hypothetical protein